MGLNLPVDSAFYLLVATHNYRLELGRTCPPLEGAPLLRVQVQLHWVLAVGAGALIASG